MGMWPGDSVQLHTLPTAAMVTGLLLEMMASTETIVTQVIF